jgi:hypothetical protein
MYIRFAFLLSLAVYVLLLALELFFPGVVSHYLSAHWLLLLSLALLVVMVHKRILVARHPLVEYALCFLFGLAAAVVSWNMGRPLEEYRLLLVFLSAVLPFVAYQLLITQE